MERKSGFLLTLSCISQILKRRTCNITLRHVYCIEGLEELETWLDHTQLLTEGVPSAPTSYHDSRESRHRAQTGKAGGKARVQHEWD